MTAALPHDAVRGYPRRHFSEECSSADQAEKIKRNQDFRQPLLSGLAT
jgi:hypothetical protein